MRTLLFLALLASGCTSRTTPEASGGAVSGTITSVDLSPFAYDGDGQIVMETASGETVRVLIAARTNLCAAEGLSVVGALKAGDRVEVVGERAADGSIRPCLEASHRVTRVAR